MTRMPPAGEDPPLAPIRFGLNELTGAFGDIGTFAPIYLGLVALCGLPSGKSLALCGAVYVGAGLFFRLPVPVQPLKAMAAIAMARHLPPSTLAAAGLWMGAILLALSATGGIAWLSRFFTRPIVKGLQLGVGLILLKSGLKLLFTHGAPALGAVPHAGFAVPSWSGLRDALFLLVIPQLPLTIGNAVFAVSNVARDYFGDQARRATPGSIALSLGVSNLVIGAAGGMPVCHGSGGMSAHYGFGARSAGATLIAGACFLLLGLTLPSDAHRVFAVFPSWLLGLLLLYPGLCHVLLIRRLKFRVPLAVLIGAVGAATGNLAYALAFGLLTQWLLDVWARRQGGLAPAS